MSPDRPYGCHTLETFTCKITLPLASCVHGHAVVKLVDGKIAEAAAVLKLVRPCVASLATPPSCIKKFLLQVQRHVQHHHVAKASCERGQLHKCMQPQSQTANHCHAANQSQVIIACALHPCPTKCTSCFGPRTLLLPQQAPRIRCAC